MCADSRDQPTRIGDYEIRRAVGEDATGRLYEAVQPSSGRSVTLKVLPESFATDPARVERFEREAKALAALSHANVARLLDSGRDGDRLYFVTEAGPGSSLDKVLRGRRLSLHEAFIVFKGVGRALEAAHRLGILHRDVCPSHILVSDDLKRVKLDDFGLGRRESATGVMETMSTAAVSMGSLHYMAPELAQGLDGADQRSDVYSAGAVFYEMLTGKLPVGRFGLPSQSNSEVPPQVDAIVLKCLASSPAERYATAAQLLQTLARVEDELGLGLVNELRGISSSTSTILRKSAGGKRRLLGVGVIALALVAAAAFFWLHTRRPEVAAGAPADAAALTTEETAASPLEAATQEPEQPAAQEPATAPAPAPATSPPQRATPTQATPPARPQPEAPAPPVAPASAQALEDLRVARDKVAARLYEPAITDLRALVERDPDGPAALDAYFLLGEAYEALDRPQQAMAIYVEIQSRFGAADRVAEARFRLASVAAGTKGREADAIKAYGQVAADFPDSEWAPKALAAAARLETAQKLRANDSVLRTSVPAALVTWRRLSETYPTHPASEEALWNLGDMLEDLKRYDLAAAAFAQLGERFPSTKRDAWWRAAQLYDKRLDDNARAIQAYGKVPESSSNYSAAQKRLGKLHK